MANQTIPARPSKVFFYKHFIEDMKKSNGLEVGADIACSRMKNMKYFLTNKLLCVDNDPSVIQNDQEIHRNDKIEFILNDIRNLSIDENTIDFLVSTHTLSHLPEVERYSVIKSFVNKISKGGYFLFNITETSKEIENDIDILLKEKFQSIKKIRYRNFISRIYESWLHSTERLEGKKVNPKRTYNKRLSKILSWSERFPIYTNMVYYFAQQKY